MFRFSEERKGGADHCPIFTAVCELSSIKRTGSASTKQNAKQIAARAVLEVIKNQNQLPLAPVESDSPKKLFRIYRENRKTPQVKSTKTLLNRHNFFMQLPEGDRIRARGILLDDSITNENKIDFACTALKLQGEFQNANRKQSDFKIFSLKDGYDCVLMGKVPDLYDRIVDYFKTMLNIYSY